MDSPNWKRTDSVAETVFSDASREKYLSNVLEQQPTTDYSHSKQRVDDGYAWFQAVGAFFLMFNTWGLVNTYGAFQTKYQSQILSGTSASAISWIGSIQTFLLLIGTVPIGQLVDRGYLTPVLLTGSFLVSFGMMMTSLCREYWSALLAQGVVVGLGYMCLFPPSVTIVAQYFSKRRALALGFSAAGGSLGAIIYTIVFQHLEPKIGFAWSTRVIALINLATLLVPAVGFKSRAPPNRTLQPLKFSVVAWNDVSFHLVTCAAFFGFLGMYIPFFYIQLYYLSQHHLTATTEISSYLLVLLNAGSFFGRILPPYFADHIGPLNSITICTLGVAILGFCWTSITATSQVVVFCVLYGFFSGAFMALTAAVVAVLTPDMKHMSMRLGLFLLPAAVGVLIGNPIAGELSRHGWLALQLFCGATLLVSWLCFAAARLWKTSLKVYVKI